MISITPKENFTHKQDRSHFTSFVIEPLEAGQSITLGNAIRRTLLSDLIDYGITGARINDIKSIYSSSPSFREDIIEILFNLKQIIFRESVFLREKTKHIDNFGFSAYFDVKGPVIVTAGMLNIPKHTLLILNPDQYICTLLDGSDFFCEIDIQKGKNARDFNQSNILNPGFHFVSEQAKTLQVDGIFSPIKNVNYTVKLIYDKEGNLKESLQLDILTRGNISPTRCLQEACKILIDLFFSLIFDPSFLDSTSKLSKAFDDFYAKEQVNESKINEIQEENQKQIKQEEKIENQEKAEIKQKKEEKKSKKKK